MHNIPVQYNLCLPISNIYDHADYRKFRDTLLKIDTILDISGLEKQLVNAALAQWILDHQRPGSFRYSRSCSYQWKNLQYALRCNIA